jgi:hypothetical protein
MGQVHLPLFKLGGLEQFLRLVPAAGGDGEHAGAQYHGERSCHAASGYSNHFCHQVAFRGPFLT